MAIARDSSAQAQSGAGVTSLTFAHNNVAGNIMWMSAYSNSGSDNFTSAAFNGTNGTKVGSSVLNADGTYTTVWYLASPATGTNNVVLTRSVAPHESVELLFLTQTLRLLEYQMQTQPTRELGQILRPL